MFGVNFVLVDFNPHLKRTLAIRTWGMVNLSELNRLVFQSAPLRHEVTVFKVDICGSNQVISKKFVVVKNVDLELWATWESCFKVEVLVEYWLGVV